MAKRYYERWVWKQDEVGEDGCGIDFIFLR
jgi:hypothetical protein